MSPSGDNPSIAIIGAGISGITTAIKLEEAGFHDYVIYDRQADVGGVWFANTYPGCASDSPAHLYSFSDYPNPDWSHLFVKQKESFEYLKKTAKDLYIYPKCSFNIEVQRCEWNDEEGVWEIMIYNTQTLQKADLKYDVVFLAAGLVGNRPHKPSMFGSFQNPCFHTAQWDHSVSLKGKTVAIVGTGASALQVIPEIVDDVKQLVVFQRKAPWVIPRPQFRIPALLQAAMRTMPFIHWLLRMCMFLAYESLNSVFSSGSFMARRMTAFGKWNITNQLKRAGYNTSESDKNHLVKSLIPTYEIGCKRILLSEKYYKPFANPKVTLVTDAMETVKASSICTAVGEEHEIDVLILATGFKVQEFFVPMEIIGSQRVDILSLWKSRGPTAYLGICNSLMPNMFIIVGPNSQQINTQVYFTAEVCVNYGVAILKEFRKRGAKTVAVLSRIEEEYMKQVAKDMKGNVLLSNCGAYYHDEQGRQTVINPVTAFTFWRRTRKPNFDHFMFQSV